MNLKKKLSFEQAMLKLRHYCAYQERCHQEVVNKLFELQIYGDWQDQIIAHLIEENFLNEERFARVFAGGKFRVKHWGKQRIERELKQRDIPAYCIRKALEEEINLADYRQTLRDILAKKQAEYAHLPAYQARIKAGQYAFSRGFEFELIQALQQEQGDED